MQLPSVEILQKKIGYRFSDPYLLECALTHSSFANEQKIRRFKDYERLEFLGDAVLEMISSAFLFEAYPDMKEGSLSKLRATLVCEPALAASARQIGVHAFIRLGRGEEAGGGREKDSILCDVMEAMIGAMYLDSGGIEVPRAFVMRFILNDVEGKKLFYDAKSVLQEIVQSRGSSIRYELLEETGPGHQRVFRMAVYIDDVRTGVGTGPSKKAAEQSAAFAAVKSLQ